MESRGLCMFGTQLTVLTLTAKVCELLRELLGWWKPSLKHCSTWRREASAIGAKPCGISQHVCAASERLPASVIQKPGSGSNILCAIIMYLYSDREWHKYVFEPNPPLDFFLISFTLYVFGAPLYADTPNRSVCAWTPRRRTLLRRSTAHFC